MNSTMLEAISIHATSPVFKSCSHSGRDRDRSSRRGGCGLRRHAAARHQDFGPATLPGCQHAIGCCSAIDEQLQLSTDARAHELEQKIVLAH